MPFTYSDEDHIYRKGGVYVPSVTRIIEAEGLVNYDNVPSADRDWYLQRGKFGHKMCQLFFEGKLDESELDPELKPRLEALKTFVNSTGFQVVCMETPFYHPTLNYAGTPDLWGYVKGCRLLSLIDFKISEALNKAIKYQLALYKELLGVNGVFVHKCYGLALSGNENPKLELIGTQELAHARTVAVAAVILHNEKIREGL